MFSLNEYVNQVFMIDAVVNIFSNYSYFISFRL
jgi:hypothetical protein